MLQARYIKHTLQFKQASGTSRGVLKTKDSWFLILCDTEQHKYTRNWRMQYH